MITKIFQNSEEELEEAVAWIKNGELIAFPTETVYGLGASIFSEKAIQKIFQVKNRPQDNPLIAHLSDINQVEQIATHIPCEFYKWSELFFPGPLTLVLQKHPRVPSIVSAGQESIALRMPQHILASQFIKKVGVPLVAPSANISGRPSSTEVGHVLEDFNGKIAGVIEGGRCLIGIESTVISLLNPQKPLLLRPGKLSAEEIEDKVGVKISISTNEGAPLSPGMKYRHYAPSAKLLLFETQEEIDLYLQKAPPLKRRVFTPTCNNLYATFRQADRQGCAEIVVLLPPASEAGLLNRLKKALGCSLDISAF